jgi:glycosyltransferase involved in cell wall biosynthesis
MMASKGVDLLLRAFAGLPPGSATLSIFGGFASYHGDDSYRRRVAPLLDQGHVTVHGALPHERVAEAFSAIDVLVVPSIWLENAPFVIREAFVAGRPVVATGHGGMAEMVRHGVSGLLFKPGSVESLRSTLLRFVEEEELLSGLRRGLPPMMTIDEDAAQLRVIYAELGAGR